VTQLPLFREWLITDSGVVTEERSSGCHGLSTTRARKRSLQNGLRTALGTWIAIGKVGTRLTTLVSTKSPANNTSTRSLSDRSHALSRALNIIANELS
jgi:hypothetical protein